MSRSDSVMSLSARHRQVTRKLSRGNRWRRRRTYVSIPPTIDPPIICSRLIGRSAVEIIFISLDRKSKPGSGCSPHDSLPRWLVNIELIQQGCYVMHPAFDQLAAAGQKHVASKLQQSGCQDGDRFSQNLQPVNRGRAKGNVKAKLAVIGRDAIDKINQTDRVGLITPGPPK